MTSPVPLTATHRETEGHDTPKQTDASEQSVPPMPVAEIRTRFQPAELLLVGWVEVNTFPVSSPATHNDADGQDTATVAASPPGVSAESMWTVRHAPYPPVGSVELTTFP
jgi:hypothetical protein